MSGWCNCDWCRNEDEVMTVADLIAHLQEVGKKRGFDAVIQVYDETRCGKNHYRNPMLGGHWFEKVWQVTL